MKHLLILVCCNANIRTMAAFYEILNAKISSILQNFSATKILHYTITLGISIGENDN